MKATIIAVAAAALTVNLTPAIAATIQVTDLHLTYVRAEQDIHSNPTFFYVSQPYTFNAGDTVDFGTATIRGAGVDGRVASPTGYGGSNCFNGCYGVGGGLASQFLLDGVGRFSESVLVNQAHGGLTSWCGPGGSSCALTIFSLLFTIPEGFNGIQLALSETLISITPPIAAPLPATPLLFIAGLGSVAWFARRRRRAIMG
jgi:hypothetical protein